MQITLIHEKDLTFNCQEAGKKITLSTSQELGGTGQGFRPMQLVLIALASCSSFDIVSILKKKKTPFKDFQIQTKGTRRKKNPSFFTSIQLNYHLTTNLSHHSFNRIINLALNKYCSVRAMLLKEIEISYSIQINPYIVGK